MSEDYVQVPRRLMEELVRCLDGSQSGGTTQSDYQPVESGNNAGTTPPLQSQPGSIPLLQAEIERLESGRQPLAGEAAPRSLGEGEAADLRYCSPRAD